MILSNKYLAFMNKMTDNNSNDEVVHCSIFTSDGLTDIYRFCKDKRAVFLKANRITSSLLCQVSLRESGFFVSGDRYGKR